MIVETLHVSITTGVSRRADQHQRKALSVLLIRDFS